MPDVHLYDEALFHIAGEPLSASSPGNTITIKNLRPKQNCSWSIVLTRKSETLRIELSWSSGYDRYFRTHIHPPLFLSMNFIHHKHGIIIAALDQNRSSNSQTYWMTIPIDKAMRGKVYDFEIVLTTQPALTRTYKMPLSVDPAVNETDESAAIKTGPSLSIMKTLIADRHSVDVQFIFTTDKPCSHVGFWAHRSILSRYKAMDNLIKTSLQEQAAREGDVGPLTIRMEKFTLATFACLIYYLYTGTIKRTINTTQFTLSQQDEAVVVIKGEATGRTMDRMIWNPLDADSSWKLKDVTWTDLLFISEHFGVKDLRDECLHEVVESIKDSNVVELLFEVGCFFEKVKDAGLDYLAYNMESMCDEGKDPFERYRDRKECHAMMLDAMRYKSIPVSRRQNSLTSTVRSLQICD
ncbi:hypothetical protein BG015_001206 [Linnemannia schmuckeri]|uniref:BTB domain-containing protein n=1 Tax=Linnemannia schmuckeri TaxID=64567 RepID=A0A9P5RS67_9FUNG|nr:hypothetical protein BG015_001206 [Linnemannia schmuckeri]